MTAAAARYQLPENLLRSIAWVEGGHDGVVHHNRDGSEDLGWMQVNSAWLPTLAPLGISRHELLDDDCINVSVGAWVLATNYAHVRDWTAAIRAYNVGPDRAGGSNYARAVIIRWRHLEAGSRAPGFAVQLALSGSSDEPMVFLPSP